MLYLTQFQKGYVIPHHFQYATAIIMNNVGFVPFDLKYLNVSQSYAASIYKHNAFIILIINYKREISN